MLKSECVKSRISCRVYGLLSISGVFLTDRYLMEVRNKPVVQPKQSVSLSVIMPVYNAERFIVAAVSSILQEQELPLELIVVNDGSTDYSLNRVRELGDPRVRVVSNWGKGIAEALNTGLAVANGEFVSRCDADDFYPINRMAQQVHWLKQHPEFGAICGGYAAIDPKGQSLVQFDDSLTAEEITQELCAGFARTHFCTYIMRAEVLRSLGGFRPYFKTGEDIDLQLRLGEVCRVWYQPGIHYHYRLHKASVTHTKSSTEREFFDAIAREFQLQRQTAGMDDLQRGKPPVPPVPNSQRPLTAAQHIQKFLLWRAWYEHQAGQKWQALSTGVRSVLTFPSDLETWRSVLALAVKPVESGDPGLKSVFLRR
jgi:GT2 family glycosyltransferase